ncbi:MAG TPA: hypothetical protein VLF18_20425 [Tahibacter sp.]|uniref:hypothetical protein n=1 Tax=Tahibacter sp. TaxID=2056211 RepID=UPI002C2712D7|nr:hypothetical protein [Tahibacter sp.]HSX62556.1 hypothetical protein [Tahibacter sp.]
MSPRTRRLSALALAAVPFAAWAWPVAEPALIRLPFFDECDSIDAIPMRQHVNYNVDIQPIWSARCANCHVEPEGGNAAADLFLDPPNSWFFLYNEPSSQDPELIRVVPNRPWQSLLFTKLNCDVVDIGVRMPRDRQPIPIAEQALVHDWILAGAPETDDDTIFRARFELRG